MKLVTAEQMRGLERAAIEAGATEERLIEEAGLAVAQETWMALGTLEDRRILVLVGPGSNGADGLVAARHLADWGTQISVLLPRHRRDESLVEELRQREVPVFVGEDDPTVYDTIFTGMELVIDALLGIGRRRPLDPEEALAVALQRLAAARKGPMPPKVLAVDLPTGVDADSGAVDPLTVAADVTVTFGLPKVGMYMTPASEYLGQVQVIDIGLPKDAEAAIPLELLTSRWLRSALPERPEDSNKGSFGKVLVVGGSSRYVSAPRLAAEAAYRAGAGLVSIACPDSLVPSIAPALAEATFLPQRDSDDGTIRGQAAIALRNEWPNFTACVVGPGMGNTGETQGFTWAVLPDLAELPGGAVFDADALNALATLPDAPERMPARAVLTPHPGEMARLLQATVADVQSRRIDAASQAAKRFGCTVVLKGAHSVVAAPDGRLRLSPFANALLASAGTGDVLAGMIAGYLAQGVDPFTAACLGVYLHGATAEQLKREYGSAGLLASELARQLPRAVRDLTTA